MTVETKGIPLAMRRPRALGINSVICRGSSKAARPPLCFDQLNLRLERPASDHVACQEVVKEGQRALIIDDFMKAGGTARG
jgi:purine operon repressor